MLFWDWSLRKVSDFLKDTRSAMIGPWLGPSSLNPEVQLCSNHSNVSSESSNFIHSFLQPTSLKTSCCHGYSWKMGIAFPVSLWVIIVGIFSSIFMKNVLLAHKNSIIKAYHHVPHKRGYLTYKLVTPSCFLGWKECKVNFPAADT